MKRKFKKSLILLALIHCSMSLSVNAATIGSIDLNAGKVVVNGNSSAKKISYKVYKNGDSGTDINKICEMGEAEVSDGKFSLSFKMPKTMQGSETDGEYKIDIKDSSKITQTFLFTGYQYRQDFVDDINTKTAGADVYSLFEGKSGDNVHNNTDIMKNLGVDAVYYQGLDATEKNKFAAVFLTEKGTTTVTQDNFSTIYNQAQAVQYINNNAVTNTWLEESSFMFEGVKFEDADSELKSWISNIIDDGTVYNSYSDIDRKYREANVLYLLDNAKFTEYDALLSSYDDAIGLGTETYYNTTYKNMPSLNQSNVNAALRNALASSKPKTKETFKALYKKAIDDEVAEMAKKGNGSGAGGGSGGGSSSSSGGMPIIIPEVTNPTKVVSSFSDISSVGWAETAITALANQGVISGYDDNTFKPQQSIKREEFVKMVIAAAHIDLDKPACNFDDVEQDKWYAQYVNAAFGAGIISGTSETDFGIGKGITREDMAVIIARLIDLGDGDFDEVFADDSSISGYAKESIYKLYRAGKIAGVGDNKFAPKEIVTRAQAAKIIYDTLVSGN